MKFTNKISSMSICATARNAADRLVDSLEVVARLSDLAKITKVYIVTNDNCDQTDDVLDRWSKLAPGRKILHLDGLAACVTDRIDRLAHARNAYLQALRSECDVPEFVLMLDMDGPNVGLDPATVLAAIKQAPANWSALFANQNESYYDLFALRKKDWVEEDPWLIVHRRLTWLRRTPGRQIDQAVGGWISKYYEKRLSAKHVLSRQYRIPVTSPYIKVDSAFGGLAVYRTKYIQNAWYGSRNNMGQSTCEHVLFNAAVRRNNPGLYICPFMTNKSPDEHISRNTKFFSTKVSA